MPQYSYKCSSGHLHDALGAVGTPLPRCPECDAPTERQSVYAQAIGGVQREPLASREVSVREFTEASEELAYSHEKAEASAGRALPQQSLWQTAKRSAKVLEQRGVNDSLDFRGTKAGLDGKR